MLIQVNHDNHIQGSAGLTQAIRAIIEGQLARFGEQITRVEVQLSDEAGAAKLVVGPRLGGSALILC